jgi:hypothetical protein
MGNSDAIHMPVFHSGRLDLLWLRARPFKYRVVGNKAWFAKQRVSSAARLAARVSKDCRSDRGKICRF